MTRHILTHMYRPIFQGITRKLQVSTIDLGINPGRSRFETLVFDESGNVEINNAGYGMGRRDDGSQVKLHTEYVRELLQEGYSIARTEVRKIEQAA